MPFGSEAADLVKLAALMAMLGLFVHERRRPAVARPADGRRLFRNLAFWGCNAALSLLVLIPTTRLAADHGLDWRPGWLSGAPGLLFDLLVLDLWIYWWHRANHAVPLFWRFHQVHHRDRALDVTTAVRFHPGEVLLSALARAPAVALLAPPLQSVLLFEALALAAAAFHHSNIRLAPAAERGLSRWIVTPGIHWVHHRDRRADTDSNYATILSVWDRLFGSRSPTARTPEMTLGVEGADELGLVRLAALPLEPPLRR